MVKLQKEFLLDEDEPVTFVLSSLRAWKLILSGGILEPLKEYRELWKISPTIKCH